MEKTLIDRKELALRWGVTTKTIEKYEQQGIINRLPEFDSPRYSIQEVRKIERIEDNPLSPLERRRLEKEIDELKKVIVTQRNLIQKYAALSVESIGILQVSS